MNNLTAELNNQNIEYIRSQIALKQSNKPYFATNNTVTHMITDMDHHPYTRNFRGVYYYPEPIVFEREAGYRKIENGCYDLVIPPQQDEEPKHCFEAACSIQYPCYPEYLQKFADKEALDVMLNRACIIQYR